MDSHGFKWLGARFVDLTSAGWVHQINPLKFRLTNTTSRSLDDHRMGLPEFQVTGGTRHSIGVYRMDPLLF
jgi:hypothetical protein